MPFKKVGDFYESVKKLNNNDKAGFTYMERE